MPDATGAAGDTPAPNHPAPDLADKLRDIQSITDAALSRLGPQEMLDALVERVREALQADTAAVLLLDRAAGHLVATAASGLEDEVRQGVRIPVGKGFAGRIAAENRCVVLDQVDHTKVVNPILLDKGIRSLMGAPLRSERAVVGVMHVGTLSPRTFTAQDIDLLQIAADRAALTVQALSTQVDRMAAIALQRSLLPSALPVIPGLQMAARLVPGVGNIGGDWYDVFALPSGQMCAVIGDVAGSGLKAAVIMGRMRSALRAYALETADPADVLGRLERKMAHFEPDAVATVLCAVFSADFDQVAIANAGHLPPILATPGEAAAPAPVASDALIGAGQRQPRQVSVIDLPPGAVLCLYTDGLVERREWPIDEGIDHLCKAIQTTDRACRETTGLLPDAAAGRGIPEFIPDFQMDCRIHRASARGWRNSAGPPRPRGPATAATGQRCCCRGAANSSKVPTLLPPQQQRDNAAAATAPPATATGPALRSGERSRP